MTEQKKPPVRAKKRSALYRRRLSVFIGLGVVVLLAVAFLIVWLLTSRTVFKDFDVSLFFGYNSAYIGYAPDKWKGQMDLDFGTTYTAIVLGYRPVKLVELLLSLGYQTVSMDAGGELDAYAKDGAYQGKVNPDVSLSGRGGFRLGLEVSFAFGETFHPVVGYNLGANSSINANILYFKQSFHVGESEKKDSVEDHVIRESEEEVSAEKVR